MKAYLCKAALYLVAIATLSLSLTTPHASGEDVTPRAVPTAEELPEVMRALKLEIAKFTDEYGARHPTTVELQKELDTLSSLQSLPTRLLGAWRFIGKPGSTDEPAANARMRFFGEHHWLITEADAQTGLVIFHHGGTYTLDGDTMIATTTFATQATANLIGMEMKFKISVEGDTYTQVGLGNPWSESWARAKK